MDKPVQEKQNVSIDSLVKLAIYLEGFKQGRGGNIQPLGNIDLENLWHTIKYLQKDARYKCE